MKAGLISYHKEPNYGTMLQAYALAEVISRNGWECEYLNYYAIHPHSLRVWAKIIASKIGFKKKGEFDYFYTKDFKSIIKGFKMFHNKYIPISKKIYSSNNICKANNEYDIFIVGSDQTWSPYMNRNSSTINFLDFVNNNKKKRSYAPSIGTIAISQNYQSFLLEKLKSFYKISCRERKNCDLLTSLLGVNVNYVIDPTLLLTYSDWNKIATMPNIQKRRYVLAYILGEKKCISDFAEALAKEKGINLLYIVTRPCYLNKPNSIKCVSPTDFIGLISNATYVVTDSFHGTIFSINYGINFYSFSKRDSNKNEAINDNDRILEFLGELGLKNRFHEDNNFSFEKDIEYKSVQLLLDRLRIKSKEYLHQILTK